MKKVIPLIALMVSMTMISAQEITGSTIEIEITNIDNSEGKMLIGLYNSEDNWLGALYKGTFGKIEHGKSEAVFTDIPHGTYAISVFHDEDNDGELDTFLGIPTEDTGSSNNAPANFGPPKWEVAKFELKENTVKQSIKL